MASGLPVVVTAGIGCDDFIDGVWAVRIPAERRRVTLDPMAGPPATGGYWMTEPNVDALAAAMRSFAADPAEAARRGIEGAGYVRRHLTWDLAAERIADRLCTLGATIAA